MKSSTPFMGGCYCGAIRYKISHKPLSMFNCHCHSCQKVSGGPYTPVVLIAKESFKLLKGKIKYHFTKNMKGGFHKRGFCGQCGSRLTGAESKKPQRWMAVTASSLDHPEMFQPESDIFVSHAQLWDLLDENRAKFQELPS